MITVLQGKINKQKVEVKIIQQGDSLTGTSYYYESPANFRRYSIQGYFNTSNNEVIWWDVELLEEKSSKLSLSSPGKFALLSVADFNCPGGGRMMLDGKAGRKLNPGNPQGEVHLDKTARSQFDDEWDFVIDNYTVGANDPYIIDSIKAIASVKPAPGITEQAVTIIEKPIENKPAITGQMVIVTPAPEKPANEPVVLKPLQVPIKEITIEDKFVTRKKVLTREIPVSGDSIELRFMIMLKIDGDSISLFLNGALLFQNIRLSGQAYIIKLPVANLLDENELTMVAENLGSIPPNTSYMVAMVGEQRYDAYLSSTEGSSAMVKFIKTQ